MHADAVVVGAGPNGLVAANALVDAGWEVVLLEAEDTVGGAVRSAEVTAPGFVTDLFSAFYPLAASSPVMRGLDLEQHGLEWNRSATVLAHVLEDGRAAVLSQALAETAASLDAFAPGDGDAWVDLHREWEQVREVVLDALFTPFPPLRAVVGGLRRLGTSGALELARLGVLPVRRLAAERFRGEGAGLLLTGNALHADLSPDGAGSGLFGLLLTMTGQDVGFPVPRGGAQRLADALLSRFVARGGTVLTQARVESVLVSGGRACGVRTAGGDVHRARRAVLADVPAPALFEDLVGLDHLPASFARHLHRFQWDDATVKVNWALGSPIPWQAPGGCGAGTVHLGVDDAGFVDFHADLATGRMPRRPFVLLGQMTTADPSRSPAGTESAWAYTHLPRRHARDAVLVEAHVERVEALVERHAPGFLDRVLARHAQHPADLEAADSNLVGGAINAGTAGLHQQLVFRPLPGLGRPETPVAGLYLAGASAHPGGGVHGACGWNAARAALGRGGAVRRRLARTAWERLLR